MESNSASSSASATTDSSINKRKIEDDTPPSSPAYTSDDASNIEKIISTRRADYDPDYNADDDDDEDDEDDKDYIVSSMRKFTSARFTPPPSNRRLMTENPYFQMEKSDVADDVESFAPTGLFMSSGAYSVREESLKKEEEIGNLKFPCVLNDGNDQHMVWLIGLKNIFSDQLPNMTKDYIVRLVMDRSHKSVMVIKQNNVVGGITYKPHSSQRFGEIAFCAIAGEEQIKGYGTQLMNHLKKYARDEDNLTHFITYADNNAIGYFLKQGFTKEITMEKDRWDGYIKHYEGGLLMEYKIDPKLPYTDFSTMFRLQKKTIDDTVRELSNCHIVYPGIDFQKDEFGIPRKINFEDIPGLVNAGWTKNDYNATKVKNLNEIMQSILVSLHESAYAWPFKEPVDEQNAPNYHEIVENPIDLMTIGKRVDSERYYITFEMFEADMRRMFANARTYNRKHTIYYECAKKLEAYFQSRVKYFFSLTREFQ